MMITGDLEGKNALSKENKKQDLLAQIENEYSCLGAAPAHAVC